VLTIEPGQARSTGIVERALNTSQIDDYSLKPDKFNFLREAMQAFFGALLSTIPPARFERAACGLGNRRSILLSYGGVRLRQYNPGGEICQTSRLWSNLEKFTPDVLSVGANQAVAPGHAALPGKASGIEKNRSPRAAVMGHMSVPEQGYIHLADKFPGHR
jgi:hypothetical protein